MWKKLEKVSSGKEKWFYTCVNYNSRWNMFDNFKVLSVTKDVLILQ